MSDIVVSILRESGGITRAGFGTALILSSTAHDYTEYASLTALAVDFADGTVVHSMGEALFGQAVKPQKIAVGGVAYTAGTTATSDLTDFLTTSVNDGRDFYFVLQEQDDDAAQVAVSTWVNTQSKLHAIRTNSLPAAFVGNLSNRTDVYYHTVTTEYPDAAAAGRCLPRNPGSLTWKFQELVGITPNVLTGATLTLLENARWNTVVRSYGRIVTNNGFLIGNLFIDQTRSQDFIKIRMEENVAQLLINNDKIPYDDIGIAQVVSVVEQTLNQAFSNGIILADAGGQAQFSVTSVARADIPQSDIDDRILRTVEFSYIEAGAIENAAITGRVVTQL